MKQEGQDKWLELVWFDALLSPGTAALAHGCQAVCCFVNDDVSAPVLLLTVSSFRPFSLYLYSALNAQLVSL